MPTAFITGGSGFIGGALIDRLLREGWHVKALARSSKAARTVGDRGAEASMGDLDDVGAMTSGARGSDVVFHAAAHLGEWGARSEFERGNVGGTRHVLEAATAAGVRRFVHVGTEAALMHGEPLIDVDETAPLRPDSPALYSATKAQAEQLVRAAEGIETVVVRPRLVWGPGDTTILPGVRAAVERGRWAWIGGGRHRTSTTHVDNVVEGLWLAATKAPPGGVYFVTDGEPVVFRDFITRLLATQGLDPGDKTLSPRVAATVAAAGETLWRVLPMRGAPPLTRLALWLASQECTIDIGRARRELGYAPVTTIDAGMEQLRRVAGP
ncbi:MAG: NAD-dependent epimerase/dehydratase family protein [Solirubrobacteraceae bacterium]